MAGSKKKMTGEEVRVAQDISGRDQTSLELGSNYIPVYDERGTFRELNTGKKPTKLEAMEYLDAWRRGTSQGDTIRLPRAIKELGERGEREARALRGKVSGGPVKKMAKGGSVSSASKRADGCAQRGKTRGKMR